MLKEDDSKQPILSDAAIEALLNGSFHFPDDQDGEGDASGRLTPLNQRKDKISPELLRAYSKTPSDHHHHDHGPGDHDHHHSIAEEDVSSWLWLAICLFAVVYMTVEANTDGFVIEETGEFLFGHDIEDFRARVLGFVIAFFANLPMLPAIIFCWLESHDDHTWGETLEHIIVIGLPFFLLGMAAFFDTLSKFTVSPRLAWVLVSALSFGLVEMIAAVKLHGFNADHASHQSDGSLAKAMWKAFFGIKDIERKSIPEIVFILWCKWGIVLGHALLGYFAASSFVEQMALAGFALSALQVIFIKVALTLLVTLFEGLTEAHSFDECDYNFNQYSWGVIGVLIFCGFFHVLPSITAGGWGLNMIFSSLSSSFGMVDIFTGTNPTGNIISFSLMAALVLVPNMVGFVSITAKSTDAYSKKASNAWCSFFEPPKHDAKTSEPEPAPALFDLQPSVECVI